MITLRTKESIEINSVAVSYGDYDILERALSCRDYTECYECHRLVAGSKCITCVIFDVSDLRKFLAI